MASSAAHATVDTGSFIVDTRATVAGRRVDYHDHAAVCLVVPLRGRFLERIGSAEYLCGPGNVLVERPGIPHANEDLSDGAFLCIELRPEFARFGDAASEPLVSSSDAYAEACEIEAMLGAPFPDELEIQCGALRIFGHLRGGSPRPRAQGRKLAEIVRRVGRDPACAANVAALAAEHGLHPVTAVRTFKRTYGVSLARYVRHCRVRRAFELLGSTETPVGALAAELGFSDQSHLTRELLAAYGTTPGALRRAKRCEIFKTEVPPAALRS